VFGSEATLDAIRERRRLWHSRPSLWVIVSSVCDVLIIVALANRGIAMTPLPLPVIAWTLAAAAVFGFVLDLVKAPVFHRIGIS
jgi:H+-transporting ATPase